MGTPGDRTRVPPPPVPRPPSDPSTRATVATRAALPSSGPRGRRHPVRDEATVLDPDDVVAEEPHRSVRHRAHAGPPCRDETGHGQPLSRVAEPGEERHRTWGAPLSINVPGRHSQATAVPVSAGGSLIPGGHAGQVQPRASGGGECRILTVRVSPSADGCGDGARFEWIGRPGPDDAITRRLWVDMAQHTSSRGMPQR